MGPASVRLTGWGRYVPERVLTNQDLGRLVETNDEWITVAHGHPRAPRRRAARDDRLAGGRGRRPRPGRGRPGPGRPRPHPGRHLHARLRLPATARLRQGGARGVTMPRPWTSRAVVLGVRLCLLGRPRVPRQRAVPHVLVIGAEVLTRILDYRDRNTCVLFGDGAGAVVLAASDEPGGGLLRLRAHGRPGGAYNIWTPAGGTALPTDPVNLEGRMRFVRMKGQETYRYATRTMARTVEKALARAGLTADDIALFVPHQANVRIIEAVGKQLGHRTRPGLRQRRPLRQHSRRVGAHRPGRGGRRRAACSPATRSSSWRSGRATPAAPRRRVDRRPGPSARASGTAASCRSRLPTTDVRRPHAGRAAAVLRRSGVRPPASGVAEPEAVRRSRSPSTAWLRDGPPRCNRSACGCVTARCSTTAPPPARATRTVRPSRPARVLRVRGVIERPDGGIHA